MKVARISALMLLMTSLSGCALGFESPTQVQKPTSNGVNAQVGAMQVRDAFLVVDPATPTVATFVGTIINTKDGATDQVVSISASGGATGVPVTAIDLPVNQPTRIGYNSPNYLLISGPIASISGYQKVTLTFTYSDSITLSLLVNPNTGIYSDVKIPTLVGGVIADFQPAPLVSATP